MKRFLLVFSTLFPALVACGQMWNGTDTLYGNEWIRYDQPYVRIPIAVDGVYRLTFETLSAKGLPVQEMTGKGLQLFHLGEEVPLFVTRESTLGPGDYVEFCARANRSAFDRYLFQDPDGELFNPEYSLITDTAAYFLTWSETAQGKRFLPMENDLSNVPPREEWFWGESLQTYNSAHQKFYVPISSSSLYHSHFEGDGFGSPLSATYDLNIPLPQLLPAGPPTTLEMRLFANANTAGHDLRISVNGKEAYQEAFFGSALRHLSWTLNNAELGNALPVQLRGLNTNDRYSIALARVRYPRTFDLDGASYFRLNLEPSATGRYLEIKGFAAASVVYDLTNGYRLLPQAVGGMLRLKASPSATKQELVLVAAGGVRDVQELIPVTFADYRQSDARFIIISHPALFDDGQGRNLVAEYADYRRSAAGGGYRTAILEVQQLYDQFGYGLSRHPQALRNAAHFIRKNWEDPRFFFLLGKGREYPEIRSAAGLAEAEGSTFFVPSFGFPASDNLLFSDNHSAVPVLPVGRLAATSPADIAIYLDKVRAFEENGAGNQTIEDKAWMKHILHLGGGATPAEQLSIRNSLQNMGAVLEENTFGAEVTSFYKTSTDPIQSSISDQIFQAINEGTSIITFFGHSSPGTFDFNIDNPDNYNNFAKTPLMLSLGCYSGNIFTASRSVGERFTFYEDKGAIAFGASRGLGFISALSVLGSQFYDLIGGASYGRSIGEVLRATLQALEPYSGISFSTLREQFTLHGDPALRLHPQPGPDYVVDAASVRFEPAVVSIQADSFELAFDIVNLGQAVTDSMVVEISQAFPDGTRERLLSRRIAVPGYARTYRFRLPTRGRRAVGLNTFFIRLDTGDDIAELPAPAAENNNELLRAGGEPGVSLFIIDNTARPVYPPAFALTGEVPLILSASTTDALAPARSYLFEIDTTALFNSPLRERGTLFQRGGLLQWTPSLPLRDSTVYYWRVSPDSVNAAVGYTWESSSFTYIRNAPNGWAQGHYWQWLADGVFQTMKVLENRRFSFIEDFRDLRIRNKTFDAIDRPDGFINGRRWTDFFRWEILQSINIVVINPDGKLWFNPKPGQYGSVNNTAAQIACYPFPVETTEQRQNIMDFLEQVVPDGYTVLAYTAMWNASKDLNVGAWAQDSVALGGRNLFNVFESQGAQLIRLLQEGMTPYIFAYRKNAGPIGEKKAATADDEINIELDIRGFYTEGSYSSPLIGPARSWDRLRWAVSGQTLTDSIAISVYGYSAQGQPALLIPRLAATDTLLDFIDAGTYPFLRLRYFAEDRVDNSAPHLEGWQVLFEGLPDAAVDPLAFFSFQSDTLQQGAPLLLRMAAANITSYAMDSLLVRFTLRDAANQEEAFLRRLAPLPGRDTLHVVWAMDTRALAGAYNLVVELNPNGDQPERETFNNLAQVPFFVAVDRRNPLLNVTFDGQRILDGDLVSARPLITIQLSDENPYLLLSDTTLFAVSIVYPDGQSRRFPLGGAEASFYPAQPGGSNQARIELTPTFAGDGTYRLIVRGRDASGNPAGALAYEVSFQVITRRSISNVLNYPNPFSTSTRFVYTLTGDEPPAFFSIQIMTASGRIVREISQDEIGPLRVGTHQTDFAWDGTDAFGDRLANGVYFYRVIATDASGKAYEAYDNGTDRYFEKGIGKLVILR